MKVSVSISGVERVGLAFFKQVKFAASKALNEVAKEVVAVMPSEMDRSLDRPTAFTKRGFAVLSYARKDRLEAVVGFRQIQAKYMQWATDGGIRNPGAAGLKLPRSIKLNEYGNIPRGVIAQLIGVARKEQGMKKVTARRVRVSAKLELFYGDPKDQAGKQYPRGIYKIAGGSLIPLIVFPLTVASYKKRLDLEAIVSRVVRKSWSAKFDAALIDAIRTAK